MPIKCCIDCTPPKRSRGCHSTCPDYLKEKEEDLAMKAEIRKRREALDSIFGYSDKSKKRRRRNK